MAEPLFKSIHKPIAKRCTASLVLICLALAIITFAVYLQVGNHQFINYDDTLYVTENPRVADGITGQNISWAFTAFEAGNWHPLTWLSHMADVQLYGMNPRGHHLTSVAIHTISALLLFLFLVRITGGMWQSAFVAALFALHPLHVESVAWVAERKDVLSAFFGFLTLLAYAEYVARRKISRYILSLFLFVLGLMSKPMLVTLPVIMLLLDYWPLGRFKREEQGHTFRQRISGIILLIREKIPFFACSLLSAFITIYAQQKGGAMQGLKEISLRLRIENALIAYVKYIGTTIWPHDLAILYPFPPALPLWQVASSLGILLLLSVAVIRTGRRFPYLVSGWFWFLITLVPVIGLIQVGSQSMADRYSYIPLTGLFIMAAWGVPELTKKWRQRQPILALLAGTIIIASAAATWRQAGYWRDNISLYRHTLAVTADNPIIHDNLGAALVTKGDLDAAIQEFWNALRITPGNKNTHYNLGSALQAKGDLNGAIREYRMALQIYPNDPDVHTNLGNALADKGDFDAAINQYREALRINPNHSKAHNNFGVALAMQGKLAEAIMEFQEALRIAPTSTNARDNLERALAQRGYNHR